MSRLVMGRSMPGGLGVAVTFGAMLAGSGEGVSVGSGEDSSVGSGEGERPGSDDDSPVGTGEGVKAGSGEDSLAGSDDKSWVGTGGRSDGCSGEEKWDTVTGAVVDCGRSGIMAFSLAKEWMDAVMDNRAMDASAVMNICFRFICLFLSVVFLFDFFIIVGLDGIESVNLHSIYKSNFNYIRFILGLLLKLCNFSQALEQKGGIANGVGGTVTEIGVVWLLILNYIKVLSANKK